MLIDTLQGEERVMGEERRAPHPALIEGRDGVFYGHRATNTLLPTPAQRDGPASAVPLCSKSSPTVHAAETVFETMMCRKMVYIPPRSTVKIQLDKGHKPLSLVPYRQQALTKS